MINSGWKFILLLVFGSLTSNLTHVLNFYNFTLQFSVENWYHFLIVRKSSTTPGNHKSVWSPSKVVEKNKPPGGGLNRVFTVTHSYPRNHYTQRLHSFSLEFPKLGFFHPPPSKTLGFLRPGCHAYLIRITSLALAPKHSNEFRCENVNNQFVNVFFLECSQGRVI